MTPENAVVDGAWKRRCILIAQLEEVRKTAHEIIDQRHIEALARVEAEYDNCVHKGLDALRRPTEPAP